MGDSPGGPGLRRNVRDKTMGTPSRPKCVYKKGGICKEHEPGATLKMKPVWTTVVGDDGVGVKK